MPPQKKRKIKNEDRNYTLDKIKATKEWTEETFKIQKTIEKGETLEKKALEILKAQNITTIKSQPYLLTKEEKLQKIIGDGGIDLFGEIRIHDQTLQWIAQCKMTKKLESKVINEIKGLLSSRPNTIGIIIYGGSKSQHTESMIDTARSDIFLCHIEELHTIKKQIEDKYLQNGIQTMSVTRMHIEEMEEVEFDTNGRITKAKRIRNVNIQNWGSTTTCQNEDILIK